MCVTVCVSASVCMCVCACGCMCLDVSRWNVLMPLIHYPASVLSSFPLLTKHLLYAALHCPVPSPTHCCVPFTHTMLPILHASGPPLCSSRKSLLRSTPPWFTPSLPPFKPSPAAAPTSLAVTSRHAHFATHHVPVMLYSTLHFHAFARRCPSPARSVPLPSHFATLPCRPVSRSVRPFLPASLAPSCPVSLCLPLCPSPVTQDIKFT